MNASPAAIAVLTLLCVCGLPPAAAVAAGPAPFVGSDAILRELSESSPKTLAVKKFDRQWVTSPARRGEPTVCTKANSANFEYIGMPIGGPCAGQVYLGGDGKDVSGGPLMKTGAESVTAALAVVLPTSATAVASSPSTQPATQASQPAGGKLVFADTFQDATRWVSEGPHLVEARDGKLHVKTADDDRKVGQYVWCRRELPDDFRIDFDVTPLSESGFFLVFFCVRGVKDEDILGEDLFGKYMNWKTWGPYQDWDKYTSPSDRKQQHQGRIRGYHISYRRNGAANCNLRKNPGLVLKKSSGIDALLPKDKAARVVLTRQGGRITLTVDGKPFVDWTDADSPWKGGRFGFRNVYDSEAHYSNVRIYDLTKARGR